MAWRHENKYMIDEATFRHLYYALSPILNRDVHAVPESHDDLDGYQVRSLYFDDEARRGVYDKLSGTDPRHKYRIRIYNQDDTVIRLEKKSKSGSLSQKIQCFLSRDQVDALLYGDAEPLFSQIEGTHQPTKKTDLIGSFYVEWQTRHLRPLLLVDYWRTPLTWPDGNVRVTFDRFLATGFYRQDLWDSDASLQSVFLPGTVILEVKYDYFLPDFIHGLLDLSGATPLAVSKYVQCAAYCQTQSWEDQS